MKRWYVAVVTVAVAVLLGVASLTYLNRRPAEAPIDRSTTIDKEFIRKVLREEGGVKAYEELVRQAANEPLAVQHIAAHMLGRLLYNTEGMDAIAVCDSQLFYGCFHSVVMAAVDDKGLDAVGELRNVCDTLKPDFKIACEHGIGHGIIGTLGYGDAEINQSLKVCDAQLPDSPYIDGCNGGVFMENIQRMMHDGSIHPLAFEIGKKWQTCEKIDAKYQDVCAFWQPMWWVSAIVPIPKDVEAFATEMGTWCTEAPGGTSAQQYCISSIGNVIYALIGTDAERTAAICAAATKDPGNRYRCQESAARRYLYSIPMEDALRACDGLYPEVRLKCRTNALRATGKTEPAN